MQAVRACERHISPVENYNVVGHNDAAMHELVDRKVE
jgi:hypothetical protein